MLLVQIKYAYILVVLIKLFILVNIKEDIKVTKYHFNTVFHEIIVTHQKGIELKLDSKQPVSVLVSIFHI